MKEWTEVRLGEVLPFKYGKALPARNRSSSGEFEVVSSAGVVDSHSEALTTGPTIVIGRKGSIGTVYYCPKPVFPIDTTFFVEPSSEVDIRFAYYLLRSLPLGSMNNDSAVPGLNRSHAEALKISIPPIQEQKAIAAVLAAIDDKIASNLRLITSLEDLGATILEWVLDLDSAGFPAYDAGTLGDRLDVVETGSRPRGGVSTGVEGVPSLGAENVQSAGVIATTQFKRISNEFASAMKRGRLENEDVLVYKDGGKPGNFIPHVSAFGYGFPATKATINEHVYRVRASADISQALLYWLLRSNWMDQEMRRRGTGVAIPGLNSTNFRNLPYPILNPEDIVALNDRLSPMFAAMLRLGSENLRLEELRDALEPELTSGRLRCSQTSALQMAEVPA